MPSKMVSIKTVTITTLDWWLHYEFGNVGLFRHQQQSWTKRKLLLINGRIGCVFGAKLCFHITFLRSRFGDPRWNRAKKKDKFISNIDGLLLDFSSCCWKTCDNELYQICIRPWAVNQYLLTLIDVWLLLHSCISSSYLTITISKGGMDEISISFVGVAT